MTSSTVSGTFPTAHGQIPSSSATPSQAAQARPRWAPATAPSSSLSRPCKPCCFAAAPSRERLPFCTLFLLPPSPECLPHCSQDVMFPSLPSITLALNFLSFALSPTLYSSVHCWNADLVTLLLLTFCYLVHFFLRLISTYMYVAAKQESHGPYKSAHSHMG